jgi:hypothetical protein
MKTSNQNQRVALAVLGALALVVATATAALGGNKLKTKAETVEVGPGEQGSATAKCPRGTKAISGGFDEDFRVLDDFPNESSRTGGRRWTSEAFNSVFGDPADLTSFAYCRDEKVKSQSTTGSVAGTAEPGTPAYATLATKCKRGTKAVSGGFDAEPPTVGVPIEDTSFLTIHRSRKTGQRSWEVRAANSGGEAGDLTVQVNCREGKGLKTRESTAEYEGEVFEQDAACKRRQRVISGGFAGPDFSDGGIRPSASMKVGKRTWQVGGYAFGEVTVYAYCEKK